MPGHLSHCVVGYSAVTRSGQHGRREIDGRSDALELQSYEEQKQQNTPQLGEMAKAAVHLIFGGTSPNVHTEAPCPDISAMKSVIASAFRFYILACWLCPVWLLFLFLIFMR